MEINGDIIDDWLERAHDCFVEMEDFERLDFNPAIYSYDNVREEFELRIERDLNDLGFLPIYINVDPAHSIRDIKRRILLESIGDIIGSNQSSVSDEKTAILKEKLNNLNKRRRY